MRDKTTKSNRVLICSDNICFRKFQFWPFKNHSWTQETQYRFFHHVCMTLFVETLCSGKTLGSNLSQMGLCPAVSEQNDLATGWSIKKSLQLYVLKKAGYRIQARDRCNHYFQDSWYSINLTCIRFRLLISIWYVYGLSLT